MADRITAKEASLAIDALWDHDDDPETLRAFYHRAEEYVDQTEAEIARLTALCKSYQNKDRDMVEGSMMVHFDDF